jgi:hypothetical protein
LASDSLFHALGYGIQIILQALNVGVNLAIRPTSGAKRFPAKNDPRSEKINFEIKNADCFSHARLLR